MYRIPNFLWSTVTTQSCSLSPMGREPSPTALSAIVSDDISISSSSSQRLQIRGQRIEIVITQLHRRHQRTGLDRVGILNPGSQIFGGVRCGARGDGVAAHQMCEVRTKMSSCNGSGNGVAVHARGRLENAAARRNRIAISTGRWCLLRLNPLSKLF